MPHDIRLGKPVSLVDILGHVFGVERILNRIRVSTLDHGAEVSEGNLSDHSHAFGFGENDSIAVVANGEDMWLGPTAEIPHPLVAGEQMTIVSSDANDSAAGTGVRTVRIEYIDGNGAEQTEDLTMNGITGVNTVATDIAFVNHMFATSRGSNGVAVGDIDIHKLGDAATVYNRIGAGGNKSLTCAMRVPAGKDFYMTEWHCSISGNKPTAVRLRSTDWGGILYDGADPVFLFKDTAFIGESTFDRDFRPPIKVPAGSTIKASAWATQAGALGSASFNGYYKDI